MGDRKGAARLVEGAGVPGNLANDADGLLKHLKSHAADGSLYDAKRTIVFRRPQPGELDEDGRLIIQSVPKTLKVDEEKK